MNNQVENPKLVVSLKKDVVMVVVLAGGGLLARILISTSGAVNGHIDAGCAANNNCSQFIVDVVKNLPLLFPFLYGLGRTVKNVVVKPCSNNPDGGRNQSISGKIE